jgi:hypothetical protein
MGGHIWRSAWFDYGAMEYIICRYYYESRSFELILILHLLNPLVEKICRAIRRGRAFTFVIAWRVLKYG